MNKFLSLMLVFFITIVTTEESLAENSLVCPQTPQMVQTDWLWYECNHNIANDPFFTHTGLDMPMSFTTPKNSDFTVANPARLLIILHRNDRGRGKFVTGSNSFRYRQNEVEIHDQEDSFSSNPNGSLWGFSGGQSGIVENYNGRRIAASIDYVLQRFENRIDLNKGLHLKGKKFGGTGAIIQAMILPDYQDKIAIVEASTGHMLLAKCCQDLVTPAWGTNRFDEADLRLQLDKVKHIHFHWEGKTNNAASQFDLEFFNLCEQFKISCSGVWRQAEVRIRLPKKIFLDNKQDVTLDRILPVITNSSANHHDPLQGHHNRGISWDHANIIETPTRIEIPLKYKPKRNIGDNIPDQPNTVTFSVTPRHLQRFQVAIGATINWQFGMQMGSASVDSNGLVSIDGLTLSASANYQTLIMDLQTNTSANGIVYVRVPRTHGQYVVQLRDGSDYTLESPDIWDRLPDSLHKFGNFNAPGQLVYQAPDGSEQILYDCLPFTEPCVPLDPSVSFDGTKVLFSVYRGRQFNNAWWNGTTLPNQQLGQAYEAQLHVVEISTGQVTPLMHNPGDADFTPAWLPDGRIIFASDRAGTRQPWLDRLTPTGTIQPQFYIADADATNAVNISPHELATAMHPYVLNNGRVAYSSHWLSHNLPFVGTNGGINFFTTINNMWMVTDMNREGGDTTALLGAHRQHSFYDAVINYPRNFKALHFIGQRENNDICAANYYRGNNLGLGEVFCWPPEPKGVEGRPGSFLPRNIYNVAAWTTSNDQRSWNVNGIYQGKISYPEGIADNQLMLTLGRGYCFSASGSVESLQDDVANQPGKLACDTGIYQTTQIPSVSMDDLSVIVDRPEWHEFAARSVQARVVNTPPTNITNVGTCLLSSSDAGTAETTPHFPYEFNNNYKTSANHGGQIDGINHDELWGMRFWEVIPNQGQRPANLRSSIGNELKYLGDAPLLTDKSFVVELPCDTPYIMAGIDNGGNVIMRDQIPQSLRPGEERVCTGCHLHSQAGRPYDQSLAYTAPPRDLTVAQTVPTFEQIIKPILQQHCVSCHTNTTNGDNDIALMDYDKLVWDFFQTSVPLAKRIPGARGGFGLHRPYTSKYVNNMFARESLLYWKAANQRLDARTDATYPDDIDFGLDHPTNISAQELKTLGLWLDSGAPR